MFKVFSVEDNKDIQELLRFALTGFGYDITLFDDAEGFFDFLDKKNQKPDLALLDIMLPGMSGIDALKRLKKDAKTSGIPVILLTAKSEEMNIVQGLEEGAADYITKPFSVMELAARIKANIRKADKKLLEADGISLDLSSREVLVDGKPISLTLKEFELLAALIKADNSVLKREELLERVWGYEFLGETRTLDMHIRTLRSKLGDYAESIITVRGVGYKLSPVSRRRR